MYSEWVKKFRRRFPNASRAAAGARERLHHYLYSKTDDSELAALRNFGNPGAIQLSAGLLQAKRGVSPEDSPHVKAIESIRHRLLPNNNVLADGTLGSAGIYDDATTIGEACAVSKEPKGAYLLYCLVRHLKPAKVVELGTNLGISSAYIGAALKANGRGKLSTLESSPYRLAIARAMHRELGLDCIEYVQGLFSDTLTAYLLGLDGIDLAFVDGHHQYKPTLDYFAQLLPQLKKNSGTCVFDDIRWSNGMLDAWHMARANPHVAVSVDLFTMGICQLVPDPPQRRYHSGVLRTVTR